MTVAVGSEIGPIKFIRSKTEEEGIHLDPATYEWCICGFTNPHSCTFDTFSGVDFYDKEFEDCKCACHKLGKRPAFAEVEGVPV